MSRNAIKAVTVTATAVAATVAAPVASGASTHHTHWWQTHHGPRAYARGQVTRRQWNCLNPLWRRESGWRVHAANPSSGAYGIPQANPGSQMRSAGHDWRNNGRTQVSWGLHYIHRRYSTPCNAWRHSRRTGWY